MAVDVDARATFREEDVVSKCGWSAFTGAEFVGLPRLTLLRGEVIFRDGEVVGRPGGGRMVIRQPD